MAKPVGWAFALGLLLLWPQTAGAQAPKPGLARQLLQGCLQPPTQQTAAQLAGAVGAKPYSDIRRRRELTTSTHNYAEPQSGQDQRTRITVTEFRGWDLPGPSAGAVEYKEERTEIVWIDRATGQAVTPLRTSVSRACRLKAPVANARAIFELYEGLTAEPYGLRISADRRWIDVFMFDPDRFDIELSFTLDAPLAGLAPDQEGRLLLSDGGPRFLGGVSPGLATVTLTRAALLAGLDRPATMTFFNTEIHPVVQRLAAHFQTRKAGGVWGRLPLREVSTGEGLSSRSR